jgi:hypothetical protein
MKWFHDVVIRSGAQAVDFVLPAIARREYQNWVGFAGGSDSSDNIETRYLGEAQVYDCEIHRVFLRTVQAFFAVRRLLDREPGFAQALYQGLAQGRIVFNYQ